MSVNWHGLETFLYLVLLLCNLDFNQALTNSIPPGRDDAKILAIKIGNKGNF